MTDAEEQALLATLRQVSQDEILPRFRALAGAEVDQKSGQDDLVTIADTRAEAAITEAALTILPGVTVVGEEAVSRGDISLDVIGTADRCLIIDPIDGTWNFANGVGCFGILLALVENGETVWGGIYDPLGNDWMVARKGQGAHFCRADGQSRPVHVAEAQSAEAAFGLVAIYLYHGEERRHLNDVAMTFRRTGNLRCSAHEYRLLADGRADFMLTGLLHPWDHAAGALIYREAGGVARLLGGQDYRPTMTEGRMLCAPSEAAWHDLANRFARLAPQS